MTFEARYHVRCGVCDELIRPGDLATLRDVAEVVELRGRKGRAALWHAANDADDLRVIA